MITINHVNTLDERVINVKLPSLSSPEKDNRKEEKKEIEIDGQGLTLIPALIDPHVHFRTPGLEHKENWESGARAAISGGITTVFDMPNTIPPCITYDLLCEKERIIQQQLIKAKIPLRFGLYFGADKNHFDQLILTKNNENNNNKVVAIKVFMGHSTGGLLMDDDSSLHAIFSLAASLDILLAVHAEDECLIQKRKELYKGQTHPRIHSLIRNDEVAYLATKKAINLARLYKTRLYILHVGTKKEIEIIREAKAEGLPVYVETTPHHLFLNDESYNTLGTRVQMNPPIRSQQDVDALWEAIIDGTIDTIGSDHAPHTIGEKDQSYGCAPSGIPGIETTLPLLLDAHNKNPKRLSLSRIISLMRERILEIFRLPPNEDYVLLDLSKTKEIVASELKTKCGHSPYSGKTLKGWPVMTILKGEIYEYQ